MYSIFHLKYFLLFLHVNIIVLHSIAVFTH